MPYKDPEKAREASKLAMRRYRARKQSSDEWKMSEADRKAAWYAENKEKKNEAQRKYRARKKAEKNS